MSRKIELSVPFSSEDWLDLLACANEREVAVRDLIHDAVMEEIHK